MDTRQVRQESRLVTPTRQLYSPDTWELLSSHCTSVSSGTRQAADYPNTRSTIASGALFNSKKFCKIFQILRHIESLDVCIKY